MMTGISSIGGATALSAVQLSTQRQIKTAVLVKDAVQEAGANAVKLIESATVNGTGQNLNVQV